MPDPRREAVLAEAREWLGTPYHHMARVKGEAVDCATFLAEVYERAGISGHVEVSYYPPDWYLHQGEERYLAVVLGAGAVETPGPPQPADIVLFRWGRCFAHGAIVIDWPRIVHAWAYSGRVQEFSAEGAYLIGRPRRFFSPFRPLDGKGAPSPQPSPIKGEGVGT